MRKMILAVVGMTMALGSFAYETWTDPMTGLEWKYEIVADGISIGGGDKDNTAVPTSTTGDIFIPSKINGTNVTQIGDYAFYDCWKIGTLTIPESIISMGSDSLLNASGICVYGNECKTFFSFEGAPPSGDWLFTISSWCVGVDFRYNEDYEDEWLPLIAEANKRMTLIHAYSYAPTKTEIVKGVEWRFCVKNREAIFCGDKITSRAGIPNTVSGEVEVPSELGGCPVTVIGEYAFYDCCSLTSVTIPSHVTNIVSGAFAGCQNLSDVYFEGILPPRCQQGYALFGDCPTDVIIHVPVGWTGRTPIYCGCHIEKAAEYEIEAAVNVTVTNVVVQYVLNSIQPNIAVPISGDTGFVTVITEVKSSGAVSVPTAWSDNYPSFTTKFGTDFGKALAKKSGKKDGSGNDMFVWQDYVAGTDPTNPDDKFTASITLVDGVPVVSYTPELTAEQQALRTYKTLGKKQLQDKDWDDLTNVDGNGKKAYNFFKVTVEMK